MMSCKCSNRSIIVFDGLRLIFNMVITVFMCKSGINTNIIVRQCALMHMLFENDQGVRLLEHVR